MVYSLQGSQGFQGSNYHQDNQVQNDSQESECIKRPVGTPEQDIRSNMGFQVYESHKGFKDYKGYQALRGETCCTATMLNAISDNTSNLYRNQAYIAIAYCPHLFYCIKVLKLLRTESFIFLLNRKKMEYCAYTRAKVRAYCAYACVCTCVCVCVCTPCIRTCVLCIYRAYAHETRAYARAYACVCTCVRMCIYVRTHSTFFLTVHLFGLQPLEHL